MRNTCAQVDESLTKVAYTVNTVVVHGILFALFDGSHILYGSDSIIPVLVYWIIQHGLVGTFPGLGLFFLKIFQSLQGFVSALANAHFCLL